MTGGEWVTGMVELAGDWGSCDSGVDNNDATVERLLVVVKWKTGKWG